MDLNNPASVSHGQPIGSLKRLKRKFEQLAQETEDLYRIRNNIVEKITEELTRGKPPSLKCTKWLDKAGAVECQVKDMLKGQDKSFGLVRAQRMELYGQLKSMLDEIFDLLEKSPYVHASMAYAQPGKGKETEIGNYVKTPAVPSRGASISDGKSLQGSKLVEEIEKPRKISEARTGNVPSQNEEGQTKPKLTKDFKKSSEPTINRENFENPFQNERDEVLLEPGVYSNRSTERTVLEILGYMNDSTATRIGINGTGGIGKTSVLKALTNHLEIKSMFNVIIWVTVSRCWSIRKIQNEVLTHLPLCLPDSETDSKVAKELFQYLNKKKFLLLLDDVWEWIDLNVVGIPDPSSENGCRMILATRIPDVCDEMNRVIKMEPVSRDEAWELFCEQVGSLDNFPGIQMYARAIVEECDGLPLLIIITGRALKNVNDAVVWKRALWKFLLPSRDGVCGVEAVMHRLKFSYDRLSACDIKRCFLYCALFSEDQEVAISELVKYCIQEGLISGSWADACVRGHDIVDVLVGASLLQYTKDRLAIKMHDVVRDLASEIILSEEGFQFLLGPYSRLIEPSNVGVGSLYRPLESPESDGLSTAEGCQFLFRGGAGLSEPPLKEEEWKQAKVIAWVDSELSTLPEDPNCPNLLRLFLQRNRRLRVIPASFFERMPCLEFLNLSNTRIKSLPQSISKLKRLKFLILRDCERLVVLPSGVGSLDDLEVLDLRGTEINKLPDEIGRLASLRHLEVSLYGSINLNEYAKLPQELISLGMMSKLCSLETLSIEVYPGDQRWNKSVSSITTEVCRLKNLTALGFCFPEVEILELFLQNCLTWNNKLLTKFKFVVGSDVKRIVPRVPNYVEFDYYQQERCLRFVNGDKLPDVVVKVLARTVAFYLDHHLRICSLSEFGVSNINALKFCIVSECPNIQSIIDGKKLTETVFPSLEHLSIHYLWNLERIWEGIIPHRSFARLRILLVHACPKLKFVFTGSMLPCVCNLEELVVEDCPAIEDIIFQDEIMDSETVLLFNLKKLTLHHLPGLVNIWEGPWPSLEYISFYKCPNLKKIGMDSKLKHSIKEIKAEKCWWDALQWDESSLFSYLEALFIPVCDVDV